LESVLRKLRIHSLKEQLETCRRECESFAEDFNVAGTFEQKVAFARRWERAIKEAYAIEYLLDRMERKEQERNFDAEPQQVPTRRFGPRSEVLDTSHWAEAAGFGPRSIDFGKLHSR
jgi:hypothetical protein